MDKKDFVTLRLCIPALKTEIVLAEPWEFDLFYEYRNDSLLANLKPAGLTTEVISYSYRKTTRTIVKGERCKPMEECGAPGDHYKHSKVIAPPGTKLTVDRIYIRNGCKNFDSVTFRVGKKGSPDVNFCGTRFWAKLRDVNRIVCLPVGDETSLAEFESFLMGGKSFLNEADRYDFLMG